MFTLQNLKAICPRVSAPLAPPILALANSDKDRMIKVHMLAQLAHESDGFKTVQEYASGKAYEGRLDLGNNVAGDGVKYKGRGYIQLTGKANYIQAGKDLGLDLLQNPQQLLDPDKAMLVSQWYWNKKGLDALALKDDLLQITKKINGGTNGFLDRARYLRLFKGAL